MTDETMRRAAKISECGRYRYALLRRWRDDTEAAVFVMLNPSTADGEVDDPTIRRCIGFARSWGAGALVVLNLFALRATDPRQLAKADDPVGPDNDDYLARHLFACLGGLRPVVAAWGSHKIARERAREVHDMAPAVRWVALGETADGSPRHPLYVRGDAPLLEWAPR